MWRATVWLWAVRLTVLVQRTWGVRRVRGETENGEVGVSVWGMRGVASRLDRVSVWLGEHGCEHVRERDRQR